MAGKVTRRTALKSAAAGFLGAAGCGSPEDTAQPEPRYSERPWWSPGGNKDYVSDLSTGTTPVRLACMTPAAMLNYPADGDINGMVRRIRERGYTAANANTPQGRRNNWLDASDSEITELKDALKTFDVDFIDIMVWTNLLHPDESVRQANLKYVAEALTAADRTGARSVTGITGSMAPGKYGMHTRMHPDNWTASAWKRSVDSIRQILSDTAGCESLWAMEACITSNIDSPKANKQIIEDVGDPRCKVCLDPTNMMKLDNYFRSGELLDECFDLMGEDILNCHAKDYLLAERMYIDLGEVPPGQGMQDYGAYLVNMSRLSWPRTLLLEHFPEEAYPPAKAFIEDTARRVGVTIYS